MKRLLLMCVMALVTACGSLIMPPPPEATIIPPTTKISDPATRMALTSYDRTSGVLRFSQNTPSLADLRPGDVLVSEPSSAAPYGYLRKVTAIRAEGGEVVLNTTQANLTDAVSKGVLNAQADLTAADLRATNLLEGVSLTTGTTTAVPEAKRHGLKPQAGIGENFSFTLHFNHVFVPVSGDNLRGQVTVDGNLSYNAGYGVHVGISGCFELPPVCVDSFEAKVGFDQYASLRVSGDAQGQLGEELKVGTQYFAPKVFFIGPVPVVLVPRLDIYLSASGQVEAKFDFMTGQAAVAQIGARWTDGDGWKNISDFDFSGDIPPPTFSGSLKPRAGAKTLFSFKLYDVAGPEMTLTAGIELDGQIPRNPNWIISGFLKSTLGFKVELPLIGTLADYNTTLFDTSRELLRAGNSPPRLELTAKAKPDPNIYPPGTPPAADLRVPVDLRPGCPGALGSFYFVADDPEDGCGVTVTVTSDKDGPLPSQFAFQTQGRRVLTVTVRDSAGVSVSKSFTLNVVNTASTLTLQNVGDPRQGESYGLSVLISDPNEADPNALCARTVWAVDAPDTLAGNSGCAQTITFGTTGPRQVRVSVQDSDGAATTQILTLNVLPPRVNPYPRIASVSLNSRQIRTSGGADFCVTVGVPDNTLIDLRNLGCLINPVPGQPVPQRYFAGVAVENPQNEPLTYTWKLFSTVNGVSTLLDTGTQPQFELSPSPGGNNTTPVTQPCRITVTVQGSDPSSSVSRSVWSGSCTYYGIRAA